MRERVSPLRIGTTTHGVLLVPPQSEDTICSGRKNSVLSYEPLEVRNMMATFAVANLNDSGAGSLRQAVIDANALAGADTISFTVAGSIQLSSALPKIIGDVDIDGTTAPGYASAPVVEVDFNGAKGLRFEAGSSGSSVESLALVDASGAGVKLNGVSGVRWPATTSAWDSAARRPAIAATAWSWSTRPATRSAATPRRSGM